MIVSETTAHSAGRYHYRELDRVRVKGKAKPVTILEPLGLEEEMTSEQLERARAFGHFLFLYRSQSWDAAEEMLRRLQEPEPDSYLYHLYQDRIAHFRREPPPPTGTASSPSKQSRTEHRSGNIGPNLVRETQDRTLFGKWAPGSRTKFALRA